MDIIWSCSPGALLLKMMPLPKRKAAYRAAESGAQSQYMRSQAMYQSLNSNLGKCKCQFNDNGGVIEGPLSLKVWWCKDNLFCKYGKKIDISNHGRISNDITYQIMFTTMCTSKKVNIVWRWFGNALVKNSNWQMAEAKLDVDWSRNLVWKAFF